MATEGTKFQVNYKLADGTLINLYAADVRELEAGLADISMNALNIITTGKELSQGSVAPAAVSPTVSAIAAQFNAAPVAAPVSGGMKFDYPGTPVKKGSKGDAVKLVQAIVGAKPDGDFGPGTEAKVKAWQLSNALTTDGVIGPVTWSKMFG